MKFHSGSSYNSLDQETDYIPRPMTKEILRGFAAARRMLERMLRKYGPRQVEVLLKKAIHYGISLGDSFKSDFSRGLLLGMMSAWG